MVCWSLGPLHVMAKGRDHEIVKALKFVAKCDLWKIEIEFCGAMGLRM